MAIRDSRSLLTLDDRILGNESARVLSVDRIQRAADGGAHGESNTLAKVVFNMWHESYHMGQLGTIRTELGYRPTAELAVQAATNG